MQKHKIINKALSYNLIHINISGELSDYINSTDLTAKPAADFAVKTSSWFCFCF